MLSAVALLLAVAFAASNTNAQLMSKGDDAILKSKFESAIKRRLDTLPIGQRVVEVGKLFLGTPYVAGTLDTIPATEKLIINLHGFDCVTFYETSLALARSLDLPPLDGFYYQVTFLRYRAGVIKGYASRLHYTTDYFYNAEQKHVLQNVTMDIGASLTRKDTRPINFMTQHRASYKQLVIDSNFKAIQATEKRISARGGYYYIPKEDIEKIEDKIQTGDILGITTIVSGLDCSHTGIAVRRAHRIYFMHASSLAGKVIISEEPLTDYLTHSAHQTGIVVARPFETSPRLESPIHLLNND